MLNRFVIWNVGDETGRLNTPNVDQMLWISRLLSGHLCPQHALFTLEKERPLVYEYVCSQCRPNKKHWVIFRGAKTTRFSEWNKCFWVHFTHTQFRDANNLERWSINSLFLIGTCLFLLKSINQLDRNKPIGPQSFFWRPAAASNDCRPQRECLLLLIGSLTPWFWP